LQVLQAAVHNGISVDLWRGYRPDLLHYPRVIDQDLQRRMTLMGILQAATCRTDVPEGSRIVPLRYFMRAC
jgi:hypothetical protein